MTQTVVCDQEDPRRIRGHQTNPSHVHTACPARAWRGRILGPLRPGKHRSLINDRRRTTR